MFSQSCCCSLEQSGEYSHRHFEIKCHKRENTKEYTCRVESNTYTICIIPHVHKKIIFLQSNSWLSLFHKSPGGIPGDADIYENNLTWLSNEYLKNHLWIAAEGWDQTSDF